MKRVIEKYKILIFIFVIINCIGLLVNVAHIESVSGIDNNGKMSKMIIHYFTNQSYIDANTEIWPFVSFIKHQQQGSFEYNEFNGIFYQYGIAEFLLYMGILLAFLVYKAYIATPSLKTKQV